MDGETSRRAPGDGLNVQFGKTLTPVDQGVDELGQGRVDAGASRYVDDPDIGVRVEHELALEQAPPPQQASGAAEAASGAISDHYPPLNSNPEVKQAPPGPSAWEAGLPKKPPPQP